MTFTKQLMTFDASAWKAHQAMARNYGIGQHYEYTVFQKNAGCTSNLISKTGKTRNIQQERWHYF
jgi:hypothetical protein